ncbi:MAG: hypothetical protein IPF81_14235 [Bacteroidetes bacterium]|nr:hypothetical protein [Bacteroidota bacterium]
MLLYVLLTLPVSFLESAYRNFYMGISRAFFKEIHGTGFVRFLTDKNPSITHLQVGNTAIRQSDGTGRAALTDVNTRIRGIFTHSIVVLPHPGWFSGLEKKIDRLITRLYSDYTFCDVQTMDSYPVCVQCKFIPELIFIWVLSKKSD